MKGHLIAVAGLLLALCANAQDTIYSGAGFGTYYYDIEEVQACGTDFEFQNEGYVECSNTTPLSLDAMNSNYVVAMNHTQLIGDMASYCGKQVIVSVNGVPSSLPLFIGDGCARCGTGSSSSGVWDPTGAPGLDFSYSVLSELASDACDAGHVDISWEIVDVTLYDFDTNSPATGEGRVSPGESGSSPSSVTSSTTTTTKEPAIPPKTPITTPTIPAVPTTLLTATSTKTTALSSTKTTPSGPCSTGVWQCNGNVLEQCLEDSWAPRVTCPAGFTCQGGGEPFCAPPNWQ
jgi:hypothetical protein